MTPESYLQLIRNRGAQRAAYIAPLSAETLEAANEAETLLMEFASRDQALERPWWDLVLEDMNNGHR